jgi:hypothetical protein
MRRNTKSQIIDTSVQEYFKLYATETFTGRITTREVIEVVRTLLRDEWGLERLTAKDKGEIYDAIREHGPVGEADVSWLRTYCRKCDPKYGDASILWGQIA